MLTISEPVGLVTGVCNEFVLGASLGNGDTVTVKVGLEIRVGPGIEGCIFGRSSLLSEIRCDGSICGSTRLRSRSIRVLSSTNKFVAGGTGLLRCLLGRSIARRSEVSPTGVSKESSIPP
jgi:hypothetical protein